MAADIVIGPAEPETSIDDRVHIGGNSRRQSNGEPQIVVAEAARDSCGKPVVWIIGTVDFPTTTGV